VVRDGFVVRNLDGSAKRGGQICHAIERICRRAGFRGGRRTTQLSQTK
jgi:hypothetical protein